MKHNEVNLNITESIFGDYMIVMQNPEYMIAMNRKYSSIKSCTSAIRRITKRMGLKIIHKEIDLIEDHIME